MDHPNREVVVTGLGPVSAVGVGCDAFWSSLVRGVSKVERRTLPVDLGRTETFAMASMPPDDQVPGLGAHGSFLQEQEAPHRRELAYALLACELAIRDAGLEIDPGDNNIGSIQVFEAPGVERTVADLFHQLSQGPPTDGPPPVYEMLAPHFYHMQPFVYVHLLGKRFGLRGFSTSVHNACSSGAFAIEMAADRIRTAQADVMLVTGGEAFETGVRMEWFRRLQLYAQDGRMAPFDPEATGFFVGEGAAALLLESADHAASRGARVYARYGGGAFAHQAWKQVIPDVRSRRLEGAIQRVLRRVDLSPNALDLIVPHGAATGLSDGYEASCLEAIGEEDDGRSIATTFKPYVGHLLAASGLIETIATLLSLYHDTVPALLHTRSSHCTLPMSIATSTTERPLRTALKISTGFTGHDTASIYQAV